MAKKKKKQAERTIITRRVVPGETIKLRTKPRVDEVITTTEVETTPKVEIRKAGTLAQALTEPATMVVKPEQKAVSRTVRRRRVA